MTCVVNETEHEHNRKTIDTGKAQNFTERKIVEKDSKLPHRI